MKLSVKNKIGIAKLLHGMLRVVRGITGRGMECACNRKGVNWNLDLNEGIDLAIYLQGAYEPATVASYRRLLRPGDIVFDIGANIGAHTMHFAASVGDGGRVYAFEPTDFAFGKLQQNLALNPRLAAHVEAHQTLLAESTAAAVPDSIYSSWPVGGGQDVHEIHFGKLQTLAGAKVTTLDLFCARHNVDRIDLLKLDVDGNEHSVLAGGTETLRRLKPRIIVELAPFVHKGTDHSFAELIEILLALGYVFTDLETGRELPQDADGLERLIPEGGGINVLLQPIQS